MDDRTRTHPQRRPDRPPSDAPQFTLAKGSPSDLLATRLQGPINATSIYNLNTLQIHYCLDDLSTLTTTFLKRNTVRDAADPESDAHRLINAPLEAFKTL